MQTFFCFLGSVLVLRELGWLNGWTMALAVVIYVGTVLYIGAEPQRMKRQIKQLDRISHLLNKQ